MHLPGSRAWTAIALVSVFFGASCAPQPEAASEADPYPLGKVQFELSCDEAVRPAFNRAVALLHHMTYPKANAAFEEVATNDPGCALAHWGTAMTLFQPLWPTRPGPDDLEQGWALAQKAIALAAPTERERRYVATAEAFFRDPESTDYWGRIRRWEQAMDTLHQAFPDDPEAQAFFALAHLATAKVGGDALAHNSRAAEIALAIYADNPLHPGAIHYLIHANDIQGREQESLDIVRSYGTIAPRNPHALHMPTHIFTRLGFWQDVIDGNHEAAEAALEHPAGDDGQFVSDEFPHAIEYLIYGYLQQGDDAAAVAQLERMQSTEVLQPTFKTAFHLSSGPARYTLERKAWPEAAALVPRDYDGLAWDRFPWPEAVTWFAKGLGAVHTDDLDAARHSSERLQELEDAAQEAGENEFAQQIRVLRLGVAAWVEQGNGNPEKARELMEMAAALEVTIPKSPVTPAPTLPAHELLGDLLMEQEKPEEALAAFKQSLALYAQRFNSLLGAARAAQALEDTEVAGAYYTSLLELDAGESSRPGLEEARLYTSR